MKKLSVLLFAAFFSISVIGQNRKIQPHFFTKLPNHKQLSVPGISDKFLNFEIPPKYEKRFSQLKEANALKQRLDSVVFAGSDKDIYVYDANGNVLLDSYFDWDGGQWLNSWKDDYTYDFNGNLTQIISEEWDGSQWINLSKSEYSYDNNNNKLKEQFSDWDGSNWLYSYKNEFVFDGENNITQNIYSHWSESPENNWIMGSKDEFVYDLNGNKTQNIQYYWNNDQWKNSSKTESVFDASENMTQAIEYGWDGENWYNSAKYETIIDANEKITEYVYSDWNGADWVEAAKYIYEYDVNGNMTLSNLIYLDGDQNIIYSKEEMINDDFGNRISYSFFEIDTENEEFPLMPVWKEEHVYDNNFSFDDLNLPFNPSDFESEPEFGDGMALQMNLNLLFKHKLTRINYFDGDGDNWVMSGDYDIYYSEQNITGAKDFDLSKNVSVYPNPATNQVTFNFDNSDDQFNIELYDVQGKLVLAGIGENNKAFSIKSLNKGMYFYHLSGNQNFYTGKLMVK